MSAESAGILVDLLEDEDAAVRGAAVAAVASIAQRRSALAATCITLLLGACTDDVSSVRAAVLAALHRCVPVPPEPPTVLKAVCQLLGDCDAQVRCAAVACAPFSLRPLPGPALLCLLPCAATAAPMLFQMLLHG